MDLNKEIAALITQHNPTYGTLWLDYSPIVGQGSPFQKLIIVNHFLRIQLGLLDVNTTKARECLTAEDDLKVWLDGFKEEILPVILTHGLPVWGR